MNIDTLVYLAVSSDSDVIAYLLEQLKEVWLFLWNFDPFPDSFFFGSLSMAGLLIGFSCVHILLDYFNGDDDDTNDK